MRALIVDDEPVAVDGLRAALDGHPDVEVVGSCGDGDTAVEMIRELRPDVVLLDIQMPGLDGFGVIEKLGDDEFPAIVFVTAHDEYAVQAFDAHAVDYLLKPFTDDRLARALDRARQRSADTLATLVHTYRKMTEAPAFRKRLLARDGERVVFLPAGEIEWLEADGNRVRVHTRDASYTMRATLSGTLDELDPASFVRAHRSAAINLDHVGELRTWFGGDAVAVLRSGAEVKVSRQYREELLRRAR
jgi:two-component system LytT family response regulator